MKKLLHTISFKKAGTMLTLLFVNILAFAQDQNQGTVTVDKAEVGNWFSENWMWIAGVVLVLLIIAFASGGSSKKTKTTTIRNDNGRVTETTTTTVH